MTVVMVFRYPKISNWLARKTLNFSHQIINNLEKNCRNPLGRLAVLLALGHQAMEYVELYTVISDNNPPPPPPPKKKIPEFWEIIVKLAQI